MGVPSRDFSAGRIGRRRLRRASRFRARIGLTVLSGLLLLAVPPAFAAAPGGGKSDPALADVVPGYLWPEDDGAFARARAVVESDRGGHGLTRERFHDLEEILRRGPSPRGGPDQRGASSVMLHVPTAQGEIPVLVRLPSGYRADVAWPLMLAMHGGPPGTERQARSGAARMADVWADAADRMGWVVAAPAMLTTRAVDRFTRERLRYEVFHPEQALAVLRAVRGRFPIDPDRVVSTGISLGSNFSIAFAAAHPDLFAAIVPVSTEGESRERLLRNLATVPVYILEGSLDANIREIAGPRAMRDILRDLNYEIVYREFAGRLHEGFQEHYDDVLAWLVEHPRRDYPRDILRVPHTGIVPLARRVHWIETDTRRGVVRARVAGPDRIDITVWHVRRLRVFLHDRLVDLDRPVAIRVNGVEVFHDKVTRTLRTALETARATDERRAYAAVVDVEVPRSAAAVEAGRRLAKEFEPRRPPGTLSFWETFAARALQERFPDLGFSGEEERPSAGAEDVLADQVVIRVRDVRPASAAAEAGLRPGDLLVDVDGEPFFAGDGIDVLYAWLVRELRAAPASYSLRVRRAGRTLTLDWRPRLGPYAHRSEPPPAPARGPLLAFDHYHTVEEFQGYLRAVTQLHPRLSLLQEIGRSRAGRPILAVVVNNPDTGPSEEKPGFYLDGNLHGGEVLGGEGALFFLDHLLGDYGEDERITSLVDRFAFYIVPLVNPDGRAVSVDTPENHRWNLRPVDEDGDGRVDEDPPEDLDGDGRILRMRVRDPQGRWTVAAEDPRLMVARAASDRRGSFYRLLTEGIDNDGDGRFNEDSLGGVDLNRNFPANWHPAQFASGPFPLSEPETRALVGFITSHPNIAAIHTYHTSGGLLLRFPTLADQDWDFPRADLEDYRAIAEAGVPLTGYENFAYEKRKIVDLMQPGHGVFNDWGSKVFGVLAMTTEMWKRPLVEGDKALLAWNDRVLGGTGFVDWYPFDHPQLGAVELGGWDRWSTASPPEDRMEEELRRNNAWVLTFAERLPRLAILASRVAPVTGRPGVFRVEADVADVGWMPTATAYATNVLQTARPVRARLALRGAVLVEGKEEIVLGTLPGAREDGPAVRHLAWQVRPSGDGSVAEATITLTSQKAGTVRKHLPL